MIEILINTLIDNSIITAFLFVGVVTYLSYWISKNLTAGIIHGSAIAITLGLVLAYVGGLYEEDLQIYQFLPVLEYWVELCLEISLLWQPHLALILKI